MDNIKWLGHFPNKDLKEAISIANRLHWNLKINKQEFSNGIDWVIYSGDSLLFSSSDYGEIEAFLYGIGLAYFILPDVAFNDLVSYVEREIE